MAEGARARILFVSTTLSGGGAERFVSTVLGHLDRARFAPHLALLRETLAYPVPDDVPIAVLGKERPWQIPKAVVRLARLSVTALERFADHPTWEQSMASIESLLTRLA